VLGLGLEGWEVPKSPVVEGWREEGRLEARRSSLLRAITLRFRTDVPAELAAAIQQATDPQELNRWFDLVFTSRSLAAYRKAVGR
jgi:hypothetical protein